MRIILATENQSKIKELKSLAKNSHCKFVELPQGSLVFPEESGKTFKENALIKAQYVYKSLKAPVLADDSGLEVDCLGGQPGIFSSRYSKAGTDVSNTKKLLTELNKTHNKIRRARFRCSMVCIVEDVDKPIYSEGVLEGQISNVPRGKGGFGYDPVFFLPELGLCMAEISQEQKNKISHRSAAFNNMIKKLELID